MISTLQGHQSIPLNAERRSIPERFVNLLQRQVRPTVRGKAMEAVEFGAIIRVSVRNDFAIGDRISRDPDNETEELIS